MTVTDSVPGNVPDDSTDGRARQRTGRRDRRTYPDHASNDVLDDVPGRAPDDVAGAPNDVLDDVPDDAPDDMSDVPNNVLDDVPSDALKAVLCAGLREYPNIQ